ncbi:MAG: hypothetical protein ABIF40_02230 [archaeon]
MKKVLILIFILIILIGCGKSIDYNKCLDSCIEKSYDSGTCLWPEEKTDNMIDNGKCLVKGSKHCGNNDQCKCFCETSMSETF